MYNTKNKTQKAYKKNKPNLNLVPKNCVCVFPIEIVGGKTLVSNQGIMPNRKYYDKGSFLYWQEVFDGRSALKIQWEDSIILEKPENQNYYLAKPQLGKYYYGKPISAGNEALEITEDASFEDFMSMKASQSITIRFEYEPTDRQSSKWELQKLFRFILTDNDIYNLYLIPEICEEKLMYIESHQEYYDDSTGLAKGCEITFATLGDKIQKSGKAIEQYCSWNAPGEFSVRPKVLEYYDTETEQWAKQVVIDPIHYFYPTPVKYLQVEQQGPALTSTIYALGRRQEWVTVTDPETGEVNGYWKIGPSKFLLPCDFIVTQPNPLNRTTTPSKNFFCFPKEQVTMVTDKKLLEWWNNQASQPLEQVKNAGMITIGKNWENSLDNKSNPVSATDPKIRKDYFDRSWTPLGYENAFLGPYDTSGSVYAGDTLSFSASDTMIDIMCKNAFIYNSQPIIPLSFYSTRPYYLRDIPLIGSIGNFFKLGDIKLSNHTTSRIASELCFFGDADIMTMCANLNGEMGEPFGASGPKCFPINFFGTNENMYQKLGVNSTNTTFCVALTDQIQLDGTVWDTIYLGQSTYEDGTELFPATHQSLLVNDTLKPISPVNSNFIIDAIVVQSIFDGKIKISCYSEEEQNFIYPEWTATILSNANWEGGNMRDWTNMFLLSNWEERFCYQEDKFNWPLAPHKKDSEDFTWNVNANETFTYTYNKLDPPNFWQTDSSGWGTTVVTKSSGWDTWKITRSKQIYQQSISYTDLGIATVTDKTSFLNYFGNASFDVDKTSVSVGNRERTINGAKFNFEFSSTTGVERVYTLVEVRKGTGQWVLNLADNNSFHCFPWQHKGVPGAFTQKVGIKLDLNANDITLTIRDISENFTADSIQHSSWVNGDNTASVYYVRGDLQPEKFTEYIHIGKLHFHKK